MMVAENEHGRFKLTQERRESLGRWIGNFLTLRDILSLAIMLVTIVGGYFTLQTRLTILETQRAEDRTRYEREVVTREVLDERNKLILDKLDNIDRRITEKQREDPPSFTYTPNGRIKRY